MNLFDILRIAGNLIIIALIIIAIIINRDGG